MAAIQLLDWDGVFGRLELLERREREVSAYRGKLHDRISVSQRADARTGARCLSRTPGATPRDRTGAVEVGV